MVDVEYANAYKEVIEILKHISKEDYNKIPQSKIKVFEENCNNGWNFQYNPELTLNEQNTSKIAKIIIAILFRDYWATEEQRKKINLKEKYDKQKIEEEQRERYNPDNLFENRNQEVKQKGNVSTANVQIIEYKENIFIKLWNKIKTFFISNKNN